MGSLNDIPVHEFEHKSHFSPETAIQKEKLTNAVKKGSFFGLLPGSVDKLLGSIKTVIFSNKLNLLMPFGPLAIMVHNLTGHKVSCYVQ